MGTNPLTAGLSVLIPARNEMFLAQTIADVLENKRGDTEIIVVLDGEWPHEALPEHDNVTVIHLPQSIGQRAATNLAARVSRAKYVMKLDAHCAVAPGFDVELMNSAEELGPDVTQIPRQYNLHVFNWKCLACGATDSKEGRFYQGRTPTKCPDCGENKGFERVIVWNAKRRMATRWSFDRDLKFMYWGDPKKGDSEISDTLSCLGACWFLSRERYWELGGMDEAHGGWGQMGTELGCKSWLSGGRMVCNKRTWFSHMFRTQGGDFGFPYRLRGKDVGKARRYSQDLWLNDKWPGAVRTFRSLIEQFKPPKWEDYLAGTETRTDTKDQSSFYPAPSEKTVDAPAVHTGPTKGIVYYSDCRGARTILRTAREQLARASNGHEIVSVTLHDQVNLGKNVVLDLERGYLTMFKQILRGLKESTADIVFLAEHDVLYHPSHFEFEPGSCCFYYNQNVWKVDAKSGQALFYYCNQTSGLCARRDLLLEHYALRVDRVEREGFNRRMGFEPGTRKLRHGGIDDRKHKSWMSEHPNIDIRHGHNLTASRWKKSEFRNQRYTRGWTMADEVPGWGVTRGRVGKFLSELS